MVFKKTVEQVKLQILKTMLSVNKRSLRISMLTFSTTVFSVGSGMSRSNRFKNLKSFVKNASNFYQNWSKMLKICFKKVEKKGENT